MPNVLSTKSIDDLLSLQTTKIDTVRMHIFAAVISSMIYRNDPITIDVAKAVLKKSHRAAETYASWVTHIDDIPG